MPVTYQIGGSKIIVHRESLKQEQTLLTSLINTYILQDKKVIKEKEKGEINLAKQTIKK